MTVTDILTEWSYRCPDGIVDLKDPIKINILNEILKEIGFQETIEEAMSPRKEVIDILISKYKNELGPHSRPGRIKNIGNKLTPDQFVEKIKETFNNPKVEKIDAGDSRNPSMSNPAFEFEYKGQNIIIVLGREAPGLEAEKQQVDKINSFIQSIEGGINIKIKDKIYYNIKSAKLDLKNKHADIILEGDENLYIQYKDANEADEFQQYSGIEKFKGRDIVDSFIDKIPFSGVEKGKGYKKEIPKGDLYNQGIFGFGDSEGDKVQIVCIGPIKIEKEGNYYTIKGSTATLIEGSPIPDGYQPYLGARYASDRNQEKKNHTRFGIYPKKYVTKYDDIDDIDNQSTSDKQPTQNEPTLEEILFSLRAK